MGQTIDGFRFVAVSAGLKASGRPDLALVVGEQDLAVAAVFTRNRVKGVPVILSQERARGGLCRALVVHAGNANACTGRYGLEAGQLLTRAIAAELEVDERRVLCAGTGVIGVPLPLARLLVQVTPLVGTTTPARFEEFAATLLTTDRYIKTAYAEVGLGKSTARLLGCAKGSGMIAPNMATALGFVFTDAVVDQRWLREVLREEVDATLNEIAVEGDTSPNDSLFVLSSGRLGNRPIDGGAPARSFRSALRDVLEDLAQQIVADGQGVTRVVTVEVVGAVDAKAARAVARKVGGSLLVRASIAGAQPNWGRILAAVGNAGVDVDPERIDVLVGDVPLVLGGVGIEGEAEAQAHAVMTREAYTLRIHLHGGRATGRHVTCDLSHDFLSINAEFRT